MTALFHGTNLQALPAILRHGLLPRQAHPRKGAGNWGHTAASNPRCVYLTDAFPLHFAQCAMSDELHDAAAILEVDVGQLDPGHLHADEDAIEQYMRGKDALPPDWSMKRRTVYYRTRAHLYSAADSLSLLGTCAYRGTIPPQAIHRVAIMRAGTVHAFVLRNGIDPVIAINAFRWVGQRHRSFSRWLVEGTGPWVDPMGGGTASRDGVRVVTLPEGAQLAHQWRALVEARRGGVVGTFP